MVINKRLQILMTILLVLMAPILVPLMLVIGVPLITVTIIMVTIGITLFLGFISVLLGMLGIPLLFSAAVTLMVYASFKIAQWWFKKVERLVTSFTFYQKLAAFHALPFLKQLQGVSSIYRDEDLTVKDSWDKLPSYGKEMEEESKHIIIPIDWHFPYPRASLVEGVDNYTPKIEVKEIRGIVSHVMPPKHSPRRVNRSTHNARLRH